MAAGTQPLVCALLPTLEVGGLEWMAVRLALAMRQHFRAAVVCYDGGGPLAALLAEARVPVYVLRRRPGVDPQYPFRLARLLGRIEADLVHAHNDTALFYGGLAAFLAGRALVYTEHDRHFPGRAGVRLANFALAASARRVVAVSEEIRRQLLRHERIGGARVRVVPNGVDLDRPDPAAVQRLRAEWGVAGDALAVGVVAGLKPVKNHALLIDAAADLVARHPGLVLVFAGDGPLRADLEAHARGAGLGNRLRLLGFRSDLARIYAALDVVVLPSHSEGMPLAALEAMAAARPVVASEVGGLPEVVVDGETGLLFPPGDRRALVEALGALLADPGRRRRLGLNGRRRYEERFTLARMADAYAAVYRAALEGTPCAE
ncbi:MAG: glycosyltransferase [Planctomycetes bacterium]|nr:glycosyltransferase [Planctomycetota bacterium]